MDHWDRTGLDYPEPDASPSLMETTKLLGFTFEAADNGICTILPMGKISPGLVSAVAQFLVMHISECGLPAGVLLDMRANDLLSIVRLSSLVDVLSGFGMPLAILFGQYEQQMLADLLHNTLAQKDYVAYFVDPAQARAYLLLNAALNQPVQMQ